MSKIFEAIENARRGETVSDEPLPPPSVSLPVPRQPGRVDVDMESEMISLYQTITAALPDINHRSVLFVEDNTFTKTSGVNGGIFDADVYIQEAASLVVRHNTWDTTGMTSVNFMTLCTNNHGNMGYYGVSYGPGVVRGVAPYLSFTTTPCTLQARTNFY